MPIYLQNKASYSRLLAGDGTEITDTSGKLDVNIASGQVSQTTHDSFNCNANLQVNDTDVGAGNKVPIEGTVSNTTHDSFNCNANLQINDTDVGTSNKVPVEGTFNPAVVGTQANAFSSASPLSGGTSSSVDCQYVKRISVFGIESTASPTITIQVSQNDTDWYDSHHSLYTTANVDFYAEFDIGARYIRLKVDANCSSITATVAGKQ